MVLSQVIRTAEFRQRALVGLLVEVRFRVRQGPEDSDSIPFRGQRLVATARVAKVVAKAKQCIGEVILDIVVASGNGLQEPDGFLR